MMNVFQQTINTKTYAILTDTPSKCMRVRLVTGSSAQPCRLQPKYPLLPSPAALRSHSRHHVSTHTNCFIFCMVKNFTATDVKKIASFSVMWVFVFFKILVKRTHSRHGWRGGLATNYCDERRGFDPRTELIFNCMAYRFRAWMFVLV